MSESTYEVSRFKYEGTFPVVTITGPWSFFPPGSGAVMPAQLCICTSQDDVHIWNLTPAAHPSNAVHK